MNASARHAQCRARIAWAPSVPASRESSGARIGTQPYARPMIATGPLTALTL